MMKKIGIVGYGAFCREIMCRLNKPYDIFLYGVYNDIDIEGIKDKYKCNVYDITKFDKNKYNALVTIGSPEERKYIVNELPRDTEYETFIDKYVRILDNNNKIGRGSIICAGTILTTNITIGDFTQINLNSTIGHDVIIKDYVTISPGVNISGNCIIGNNVYIGTNASIKQKINICDKTIIGLNSGVTKNILESGIYIGTPVTKK
jgi:sugar O-acyltransferase (sialic acid O-acetyltransferase NeuD family)